MTPWHIDALDARGGLAVASQRSATLTKSAEFETGPSVFIAPPSFVPEFVGSRAIGFGLARGDAQIGLFVDGEEVAFPSAGAVAEFVRRTFLGGTSGDGPGETGGSSPPGPEGRPPPIEPGPLDSFKGSDPVPAIAAFAKAMGGEVSQCGKGNARAVSRLTVSPLPYRASHRLVRGAALVHAELMARVNAGDDVVWAASAHRLLSVLCRLGLCAAPRPPFVRFPSLPSHTSHAPDVRYLFELLNPDHPRPSRAWLRLCGCCCVARGSTDPFDDLAFLPTPLGATMSGFSSLQSLLAAFVAAPDYTLNDVLPLPEQDVIELVLLASTYIVLGGDQHLTTLSADPLAWSVEADQVLQRALVWLGDNLPKQAFATGVEAIIMAAAKVAA